MASSPLFSCRANGKLLLTGEYLVLDGALALAAPTLFGQTLEIFQSEKKDQLHWQSFDNAGNCWFDGQFRRSDLSILQTSDPPTAVRLVQLLNACRVLQPGFLTEKIDLHVKTALDFPRNWGLGSSSTLVHCLSKWAGIDQFALLKSTFGGSGYDLACANADGPIFYEIKEGSPGWKAAGFNPPFKNHLYFVYLDQKQNSREGIRHYRKLGTPDNKFIDRVSGLTSEISAAQTLSEFERLIEQHEALLSDILKIKKVKDRLFSDYWGAVKSLGAWGGDFVMVTSGKSKDKTKAWFKTKGFETILDFGEMILV